MALLEDLLEASGANSGYISDLYNSYQKNSENVSNDWKNAFDQLNSASPAEENTFSVEYQHLHNAGLRSWLKQKMEAGNFHNTLTIDQKKLILHCLNKSELFETFLHKKYPGQKRFSLEGAETLIPMLTILLERGAELGMEELIMGMAHRGRLNVLTNILNKSYATVFSEFGEHYLPGPTEKSGDVKYHKGFTSRVKTESGKELTLILIPNPSHLESVYPVVQGFTRGKLSEGMEIQAIVPLIIHGDAAIAGQGVVYETLQLSRLEGYASGGTVHIVINNQIGFTTLPKEYQSTEHCTDIAKTFGLPVFHVDAEAPETCIFAMLLAIEIRQKFQSDVFINLKCYRKYGHNESDEPFFTQPLEYKIIGAKRPIRELYRDHLIHQSIIEQHLAESMEEEFTLGLQEAHESNKNPKQNPDSTKPEESFNPFLEVSTALPKKTIDYLAGQMTQIPEPFKAHKKLIHLQEERKKALSSSLIDKTIDWGTAENLAYASLLVEGTDIRISGQDVRRGTFSHRHAVLIDQENASPYFPLQHLQKDQGCFEIHNSSLSEYGVLGFEYGWSIASPDSLVIWEAQFGDFANGAQVMIDQFIATAEQKWGQHSALTLFLPHGYEGQGPEHSSARIERYLTLSGDDNWQVVYPSTPAQLFHLLRRQIHSHAVKPLVVFTPKALLRHPRCQSSLQELTEGKFNFILDDPRSEIKVNHIIFCTGRIYYDIMDVLEKQQNNQTAVIRIQQLYPLALDEIKLLLKKYNSFKNCAWVQEEPSNMGAWEFIHPQLNALLPQNISLKYVGRKRSASTAVGSPAFHKKQHDKIMAELIEITES